MQELGYWHCCLRPESFTLRSQVRSRTKALTDEITKHKLAEDELRTSERRLKSIYETVGDVIFLLAVEPGGLYRFSSVNPSFHRVTGLPAEAVVGRTVNEVIPEPSLSMVLGKYRQAISEKTLVRWEEISDYPTGQLVGEVSVAPVCDDTGNCTHLVGSVHDITERKHADELLMASEEKYRTLVENINDVFYSLDSQGNITYVSPVVERLSHYKASDLIGKSFTSIIFPDDLPGLIDSFNRLVSGQLEPWEFRILDKDGSIIFVRTSSRPLYEDGQIVGITALITDITERKKAEEELIISYEKTKKTLNDAINTMAKLVEMRDPYTAGHQHKVAQLATAIAKEIGCGDDQIEQIRMAATIHDIGKIYVPSDILSKPGKVSEYELKLLQTHSQGGYNVVTGMDFPPAVAQSILQHHERLDGSGYPNNLKGEEICLEAKILSVADVVEAMGSHRPYRPALGIDKALEEITTNKGKLYDPDIVDACIRLFTDKGFKFTE